MDDSISNSSCAHGKPHVELFGKNDIKNIKWPDTELAVKTKEFFLPMMENGISRYVRNIHAELYLLSIGNKFLPIAVIDGNYDNSMVASPYTMYTSLTLHELNTIKSTIIKWALLLTVGLSLRILQPLLKLCQFNRVVLVNGYPFSTTLYPLLNTEEIETIKDRLMVQFPRHTIIFRTIDDLPGKDFKQYFIKTSFRLIYHRPTYHLDPVCDNFKPSNALRRDIGLLRKTPYQIISGENLTPPDISRITQLYHDLFIEKYNAFNPQYTTDFFQLVTSKSLLEVFALKKDNRVDGFIGFLLNDKVIADPFLGHDEGLPKSLGIYRMLVSMVYLRAKEKGLVANYSAGVGAFKRRRGCQLVVEYIAVFDRHLPVYQRLPWVLLQSFNPIALFIMGKVDF